MKTYGFQKINCRTLALENPLWRGVAKAQLDEYNLCLQAGYPQTAAQGVYSEQGLTVRWESSENPQDILARYHALGDPAYRDSCVEIFFNPDPENDGRYLNFEVSAGGALRLGLGTGRHDKTAPEATLEQFEIETQVTQHGWQAKVFIPFSFVLAHFARFAPQFRGNFQKCGDDTAVPHFPTWNKIDVPAPDFHRPEFFGNFVLEGKV